MKCPKCGFDIRLFSEEWQSQRESSSKHCPACKVAVEVVLDRKKFAPWFFGAGGLMFAGMLVKGLDWPVALFFGFMLGAPISVLPSLSLRLLEENEKGLRAVLNRPMSLPQWLTPEPQTRALGRGIWATFSVVAIVLMTLLTVPSPWSGVLLFCVGAFGMWRKTIWLEWFKLQGRGATVYAATLLTIGLALIAKHYV